MARLKICTACGYAGNSRRVTKGSLLIELFLWLCLLVPGVLYSLWRMTTKHDACPKCGSTAMVPADSPMGAKLARELNLPPAPELDYPERI